MKKRLIFASTQDIISVKIGCGTDSRTEGTNYWFIYPERNGAIDIRELWDRLGINATGAIHFESEREALEYIQECIADEYDVIVEVHNECNHRITTLHPRSI